MWNPLVALITTTAVLFLLLALRMAQSVYLNIQRARERRAHETASRLQAELRERLERLEELNRRLRQHVEASLQRSASVVPLAPGLIQPLRDELFEKLRERTEKAYHALLDERSWRLEGRCSVLADLANEIGALEAELQSRDLAWCSGSALHRADQAGLRPALRVA